MPNQKNYKQDACQTCIEQDESNMPSLRNKSFYYTRKDTKIHSLTMEADYRCNLACAMCGPHLSSTWYEQRRTHQDTNINFDLIISICSLLLRYKMVCRLNKSA